MQIDTTYEIKPLQGGKTAQLLIHVTVNGSHQDRQTILYIAGDIEDVRAFADGRMTQDQIAAKWWRNDKSVTSADCPP